MTGPADTIDALLADATATLRPRSDSPRLDAEVLLAHCLKRPRSFLIAHGDEAPEPQSERRFLELVAERAAGKPVAYLTGEREFWSLTLTVTADTLIPRPETERLVEVALERIPADRPCSVVDLGTGSGAIAIALASERPLARVVATDMSAAALDVARSNARRHGIERIEFLHGDWFAPLAGRRFDLIVSNPPYVTLGDPHLERGDVAHEPRLALLAGPDGLDAVRRIATDALAYLNRDGALMVEHGGGHGPAVREIFSDRGFGNVQSFDDLAGSPRVTIGTLSSKRTV